MKNIFILLLSLMGVIELSTAQKTDSYKFDSLVSYVVELSHEELYNSNFDNALKYLEISFFKEFSEFEDKHEILIRISNIRVQSFKARLYQTQFGYREQLEILKSLQPKAERVSVAEIKAKYYSILSSFYRSENIDSCEFYENRALDIYHKTNNNEAIAELRATRISRVLDNYLEEEKRELVLGLIPGFKEEIEFSEKYSLYALAYNTRHLANIYRIFEVDLNEALRLYKQSLLAREKIGFSPFIPASHYSIGEVYSKLGKHDLAIEAYEKSLKTAHKVHFTRYEIRPLIRIGDIYTRQGNDAKARDFYARAIKAASKNSYSEEGIDTILEKLGSLK